MKLRAKVSVINLKRARTKSRLMVASFLALALVFSSIAPLQQTFKASAAVGDYLTKHTGGKGDSASWTDSVTSSDGSKVFVTFSNSAYFSQNYGETWEERALPNDVYFDKLSASADLTKIAFIDLNSNSLYISTNSGITWNTAATTGSSLHTALYTSDGNRITIASSNENNEYLIHTSVNNGVSWQQAQNTNLTPTSGLGRMTSNDNGTRLTFVGYNEVFTSTNSGASWTRHEVEDFNGSDVISSGDGRTLLATAALSNGASKLMISTDYGATWSVAYSNDTWDVYSWTKLSASYDGDKLIASLRGEGSSYVSENNGASWSMLPRIDSVTNGSNATSMSSNGSVLYSGVSSGSFYRSANFGQTWTQLTVAGIRDWQSIKTSSSGKTIFALQSSSRNTYLSNDFGASWKLIETLSAESRVTAIEISADGTTLYTGEYDGTLHTSRDGGETWTTMQPLNETGSIDLLTIDSSGSRVVIVTDYYTLTSGDYGQTWNKYDSQYPEDFWLSTSIASNQDGSLQVVTTYDNIYLSRNFGQTWEVADTLAQREFYEHWVAVDISADGQRIVASQNSGQGEGGYVYISDDTGETWTQVTDLGMGEWLGVTMSADGRKISVADGNMYSEYGGNLHSSSDYGLTWSRQSTGAGKQWTTLTSANNGNRVIAAGTSTAIYSLELDQPTVRLNPDAHSNELVTLGETDTENRRTITNRTPVFSGKTFPGGAVTVTVNSDPITCETVADAQGDWSCELPEVIPFGNHTISAAMVNPGNNTTEPIGPFLIAAVDSSTLPGEGASDGSTGGETGTGNGAAPGAPNTGFQKLAYAVIERPVPAILILIAGLSAAGLFIAAAVLRKKQQ